MDQPTSWPCVDATMRRAPAWRSGCPSSASGAAAPNQTASQSRARMICFARRRTSGVGSISDVGCRTTSNGASASNSSCDPVRDSHDGA